MSTTSCCRAWRSAMCCARRMRTPASARSTSAKAKAAPGVLAVLTGADWIKSGWGDLPVPGGHKRRDGSPQLPAALSGAGQGPRALGRRLRRLRRRRDQAPGGGRRRTDRGRLRAAAGRRSATADAAKPGAPLVWDDCKDNICFVADPRRQGRDRSGLRQGRACRQAAPRDQPRHRRVDGAARLDRRLQRRSTDHYTIYTTLQRAHPYRAELAKLVLKVPEHKVRVVAGDIGGSFGMKSAIYNEVALVLLGVQGDRPAGEMDEHALGSVPQRRAGARQRHRRRACARQGRHLPRLPRDRRPSTPAPICNPASRPTPAISARSPASTARRRCTWNRRRCSPTPTRAALSRQRPAGSGLCDRAHGRSSPPPS